MTTGGYLQVQATFIPTTEGEGSVIFRTPSIWGGKQVCGISFVHSILPGQKIQVMALGSGASVPINCAFSAEVLKTMEVFIDVRGDSDIIPTRVEISNREALSSQLNILWSGSGFRGEWCSESSPLVWYGAPEFRRKTMSSRQWKQVLQQQPPIGPPADEDGYEGGAESNNEEGPRVVRFRLSTSASDDTGYEGGDESDVTYTNSSK